MISIYEMRAWGVWHGDIKPQNVMVVTNKKGELIGLKIIDFGSASSVYVKDGNSNYHFSKGYVN